MVRIPLVLLRDPFRNELRSYRWRSHYAALPIRRQRFDDRSQSYGSCSAEDTKTAQLTYQANDNIGYQRVSREFFLFFEGRNPERFGTLSEPISTRDFLMRRSIRKYVSRGEIHVSATLEPN